MSMEPVGVSSRRRGPVHGSFMRIVAVALIAALAAGSLAPPCRAEASEQRLESLTKATIYGALLGGLLGLTSALVVKDSARDDVIRWGIALGAFSGFAYGVFGIRNEPDRLSEGLGGILPVGGNLGVSRPGEKGFLQFPEVTHDGFKEEGSRVQRIGARPFAGLEEAGPAVTPPKDGARGFGSSRLSR